MPFDTVFFIFIFLPIALLVYSLTQDKYKGAVLLFWSLFFYSYFDFYSAVHLLAYSMVIYLMSIFLVKVNYAKWGLVITISAIVAYLIYYKYAAFILSNVFVLFPKLDQAIVQLHLPLGVSFYSFTAISYLVDLFRERSKTISLLDFLNYFTFFPKIISGPLVRSRDFMFFGMRADNVSQGLSRFIIGLTKKVVFAYIFGTTVDKIWGQLPFGIDTASAWIGALSYTLQIYFDFSGYSDMAIGISKMFGYSIGENFNFPYISTSITDFWRRWHITLGAWFRDYIYFPLGGSRKRNVYMNMSIVFLITGIWHGANWTFILWGIWHGLLRLSEKALGETKFSKIIPKVLKWLFTFLAVMLGWVLFRSASIAEARYYIGIMFGLIQDSPRELTYTWEYFLNTRLTVFLIVGLASSTLLGKTNIMNYLTEVDQKNNLLLSLTYTGFLAVLLMIDLMMIFSAGHSPFIYFQF